MGIHGKIKVVRQGRRFIVYVVDIRKFRVQANVHIVSTRIVNLVYHCQRKYQNHRHQNWLHFLKQERHEEAHKKQPRKIDLPNLPYESEKYQCTKFITPDKTKYPKAGIDLKETAKACLANIKCIGVSNSGKCNGVRNSWKDQSGKTRTEIHRLCGGYKKVQSPGQCTHCVNKDCKSRVSLSTEKPKSSTSKLVTFPQTRTTRRNPQKTTTKKLVSTTRKIDLPNLPYESEKYQCTKFITPDKTKYPKAGIDLKETAKACLANIKCIGVSDSGKCNGVRNSWKDKSGKRMTEIHRLCGGYKKVQSPGQCT